MTSLIYGDVRSPGAAAPLTIKGLVNWWDPAIGVSTTTELVDSWKSVAGRQDTLTAPTTRRPKYIKNYSLLGGAALRFDGVLNVMQTAFNTPVHGDDREMTVAMTVVQPIAATDSVYWCATDTAANGDYTYLGSNGTADTYLALKGQNFVSKSGNGGAVTDARVNLVMVCTGTTVSLWLDGVEVVTDVDIDVPAVNANQFAVGALYRGAAASIQSYLAGDVGDVLMWNRALDDTEVGEVSTFLAGRHAPWQISLPDLEAWWAPAVGETILSDELDTWTDRINAYALTAPTNGMRPEPDVLGWEYRSAALSTVEGAAALAAQLQGTASYTLILCLTATGDGVFWSAADSSLATDMHVLQRLDATTLRVQRRTAVSSSNADGTVEEWGGGVHVVALTFDGTSTRSYVDGALITGPTAHGQDPAVLDNFTLGKSGDSTPHSPYDGTIYECITCLSVYSLEQIQAATALLLDQYASWQSKLPNVVANWVYGEGQDIIGSNLDSWTDRLRGFKLTAPSSSTRPTPGTQGWTFTAGNFTELRQTSSPLAAFFQDTQPYTVIVVATSMAGSAFYAGNPAAVGDYHTLMRGGGDLRYIRRAGSSSTVGAAYTTSGSPEVVAAVYDGTNGTTYLDGVVHAGPTAAGNNASVMTAITMGVNARSGGDQDYLSGTIHEVIVCREALDTETIASITTKLLEEY